MASLSQLEALHKPGAVYIAFEVFPRAKGASTHIAAMVRALARRYAPVLLLCCGHGEMPALQLERDILVRRHKMFHPNMLRRALDFGQFVHHILSGLEAAPQVLVFRDPWSGVPALEALPDCPAVFEVNALPTWELPYRYPGVSHNAALRAKINDMERFCLGHTHALITVSSLTKEALVARGVTPSRIEVIPNAADDCFFNPGPDNRPAFALKQAPCDGQLEALGQAPEGGPIDAFGQAPEGGSIEAFGRTPEGGRVDALDQGRWFGYFGSLHPWQGVDTLIDAWSLVAPDFPEVRLLIVHNNRRPPLKRLREKIRARRMKERVLLQSPLPPSELARVLKRLEFTCAPLLETARNTVQGCCPVKVIESMAAGTPVLGSNLRVLRELIRDGIDGTLVAPGERRALAQGIRSLLTDGALRRRLAESSKKTASQRFTMAASFGRLLAMFEAARAQDVTSRT